MQELFPGSYVTVAPGVFWKGEDLSGRVAQVVDTKSYILVEIKGINGQVKLFRSEITDDTLDYLDGFQEIFETGIW